MGMLLSSYYFMHMVSRYVSMKMFNRQRHQATNPSRPWQERNNVELLKKKKSPAVGTKD